MQPSAGLVGIAGLSRLYGALKQAQVLRAVMAGFLTSFQAYIKIEVVETAWDSFCQQLDGIQNLDQLIGGCSTGCWLCCALLPMHC